MAQDTTNQSGISKVPVHNITTSTYASQPQTLSNTQTDAAQYLQQQSTLSNLATSTQSIPQTQQNQIQHFVPTIQNTNQIPLQPQIVYAQQQGQLQQPYVQNSNSLVEQVATNAINKMDKENALLKKQLEKQQIEKTSNQQVNSVVDGFKQKIIAVTEQQLNDTFSKQQEMEEKKQEELEQLRKYKEEQEKKEEVQRQKEELEKKFEVERSEIKNQQQELDDRENFITLMEKNTLINKKEFDQYIKQVNTAKDIKAYSSELDASYEQQYQMNNKRKEQQLKLVSDIDKGIYRDAEKLDKLNEKLNRKKAGENIFVKIINFITRHEDKESKKIKEEIEKLSKKIDEGKLSIEEQREELKRLENNGIEIMKKRADDMAKNSKSQINELKARREQYNSIINTDEYKNKEYNANRDYITGMLERHQQHVDLIKAIANKEDENIYSKYDMKKINQKPATYSRNDFNQKRVATGINF